MTQGPPFTNAKPEALTSEAAVVIRKAKTDCHTIVTITKPNVLVEMNNPASENDIYATNVAIYNDINFGKSVAVPYINGHKKSKVGI